MTRASRSAPPSFVWPTAPSCRRTSSRHSGCTPGSARRSPSTSRCSPPSEPTNWSRRATRTERCAAALSWGREAAMDYRTLGFELRDHVARITLNRPDSGNALDGEMGRELMHLAIRCSEERAVRAVLLTGAGRMFCVGGDLKSFAAQGERLSAHLKELAGMLHMAISRLVRMDAPLIVAANGAAGGGGMSFVLAADLVLAAESAKFTMAYTKAGLSPDGGSTYFLPRMVGVRRALELAISNRVL